MLFDTKTKQKTVLLVLLCLIITVSLTTFNRVSYADSDESGGDVFTLQQVVALALERSLTLVSAQQTVDGAKEKRKEVFKNFLPTISGNYTYTRLDNAPSVDYTTVQYAGLITNDPPAQWGDDPPAQWNPVVLYPTSASTGTRDLGSADMWQLKATLTQPIFTGFALLSAYEMTQLGIDLAKISQELAKLDLILDVKKAFFTILSTQKLFEVADQAVKQVEAHLNVAKNFYDVGMVPKNQVLQAEVQMAQAIQRRIKAENGILLSKARLNTMLRRALEEPLTLQDLLTYKPFPSDFVSSLEQAFKLRPEIRAVKKQIQLGEVDIRLKRAGHYPTIAVVANHYWKGDTPRVRGSPYSDDPSSWDVTAALTWDFKWGQSFNKVSQSKIELAKVKNTLTKLMDGITLEVKSNYLSLKEAEKNIAVAKKAIELAEENFRMSQERFREQVATSTEVTDAATLLTSAKQSYYESLYNYNLAWAALERAMGLGRDTI